MTNTIDTVFLCFEQMRDLQIELQAKLILTNQPPDVWREEWSESELETLTLHPVLFDPERSYQACLEVLNQLRRDALKTSDETWEFLIAELQRFGESLVKLTHRFYIIEEEINNRSRDVLVAYKKLKKQLEITTNTLNNAQRDVPLLIAAQWAEDKKLIFKYQMNATIIQCCWRAFKTRRHYKSFQMNKLKLTIIVKKLMRGYRYKKHLRIVVVPALVKVQAHCRRHLAGKIIRARMEKVCGKLAAVFNPLCRKWYFEKHVFFNGVLKGFDSAARTMQRLFRGHKGRKKFRKRLDKKRRELAEKERKKKLMADDQDLLERKAKMKVGSLLWKRRRKSKCDRLRWWDPLVSSTRIRRVHLDSSACPYHVTALV